MSYPEPTVITEYGITDGTGDAPEHLGSATRQDADRQLAAQRRLWDELPIELVQRTVTTTPWVPVDAEQLATASEPATPEVGQRYTSRLTPANSYPFLSHAEAIRSADAHARRCT